MNMKLTHTQITSLKGHALNMMTMGHHKDAMLLNDILDNFEAADKVVEAVRQDLLDRSNVGIKKYGTTLDSNRGNLRYWLNHAYEEALDMANYLKRSIMELDSDNGNSKSN